MTTIGLGVIFKEFCSFQFLFLFSSMQEENWIVGLWKFSDRVSQTELAELASEWSNADKEYLQLYVRKTSKDQFGIGFMRQVPEDKDPQIAHKEYLATVSDLLKRQYGNDFVGWDIATKVYVVK